MHFTLNQQSHFTLCSSPRYRKCERIEKGKIERIMKPIKGMSLIRWHLGDCSVIHSLSKRNKTFSSIWFAKLIMKLLFSQSRRGGCWDLCQAVTMETGASEGKARDHPRCRLESGNSPCVTSHHAPTAACWSLNLRKRRKKNNGIRQKNQQSSQM